MASSPPVTESYLRDNLARATAGDRARLLVFYCLKDCWMSWNAAKRALAMGYTNVAWYPDGTDGWVEVDFRWSRRHPPARRVGKIALLMRYPRGQPRARRFCPRGPPGAVAHPTHPRDVYSAAWAIARPSANSRRSITVGTSQT